MLTTTNANKTATVEDQTKKTKVVDTPVRSEITENDMNSNRVNKRTTDTTVTKIPVEKPEKEGKKVSYMVGIRDKDSGQFSAFDNAGTLFFGTQEDAEGLKKYAESQGQGDYQIVKV